VIQVQDIIYVRYQAPDLDVMERFLIDFGMQRAERTATTLYMRGCSTMPYIHVTDLGSELRSNGFALLAQNEEDVERLASEMGLRSEWNPEPAGGLMLQLTDPSGFDVTVLGGLKAAESLATRQPLDFNPSVRRNRLAGVQRVIPGPSHVFRLGHVLLRCTQMDDSLRFYTERLGFQISDSGYAVTPDNVVGHFLHCGLGNELTDHHTIAVFKRPESKIDHSGFEVLDMDDLIVGNEYLKKQNYRHQWGVGRHVEGSQIFDYWRDPFGNKIEHWTDGDLVNDRYVGKVSKLSPEGLSQWGPPLPQDFYL
jgi:catechol 2,3-dioxygenase-like lactoylglutathione lyase family enzyme